MRHLYHILSQSSGIMEEGVVNVLIKSDKIPSWTWEGIMKPPQLAENVCAIVSF